MKTPKVKVKEELTPEEALKRHSLDFSERDYNTCKTNNAFYLEFAYLGRPESLGGRLVELVRRDEDFTMVRLNIKDPSQAATPVRNDYLYDLFRVRFKPLKGKRRDILSEDQVLSLLD